jgi:hypothetical protein
VGKPPPDGEFSVAEFFADGTYRYVERWLPAKEAVELAKFWTDRPAASLGWMTKVIITDGGDFTVFEWQHGKGVIYPPREQKKIAPPKRGQGRENETSHRLPRRISKSSRGSS